MTPAERIAAEIAAYVQTNTDFPAMTKLDVAYETARLICGDEDVLWAVLGVTVCPKGERIVLDRTGDTDRLIKQSQTTHVVRSIAGTPMGFQKLWVDSPEGSEQ